MDPSQRHLPGSARKRIRNWPQRGVRIANHLLRVVASVHGANWDIFREYDFRVRSQHAAARRSMSRIGFDIRQLNQQLLGLAAGAVRPDGGANGIIDITGAVATPWARLIASPYPDRARIARAWSSTAAVPSAPPPPAATSTSTSPKRKVPRVGGAFGPSTAPTTSFGPASSFPSGPTSWCPLSSRFSSLLMVQPSLLQPRASSPQQSDPALLPSFPTPSNSSGHPSLPHHLLPAAVRPIEDRLSTTVAEAYAAVVTPLAYQEWLVAIAELPVHLQQEYADLPEQIRSGFWLGLPAKPAVLFHPFNRYSEEEAPVVLDWITAEVNLGRAFGPFSDDEMAAVGPWRSAPLSVIHTPATAEKAAKNRIVEDLVDCSCDVVAHRIPGLKFGSWVDDIGAIRAAGPASGITEEQVRAEFARLGWPLHPPDKKGFNFSRRFVLTGIEWDLDAMTMAL
ncbi:hypothetical protein A4X06_0g8974, partial [Tilletia controversa]